MGDPHEHAPQPSRAPAALRQRVALRCTYCHDDLARDDAAFCATCLAPHHGGCQRLHGRCAAPGCAERAVVRPRTSGRRLRRQPEPERARRADEPNLPGLVRSSLVGIGVLVVAVIGAEGVTALLRPPREVVAAPAPAVIVVDAQRPPMTVCPTLEVAHPASTPNARLQLTADGFTFPLLLAPDERLVVLRADSNLHVARLDPDGSAHAVFVALGAVDIRLPAGHDIVSLDGAEPITVDVDTAAPGQQLLRRRRATPEEVRRALETSR